MRLRLLFALVYVSCFLLGAVTVQIVGGPSVEAPANFDTAVATCTNKRMIVGSSQSVANTVSVAASCDLEFQGAGALSVASTKVVTMNGQVLSPRRQIFSGSGTVAFPVGTKTRTLFAEWWGATCDGTTDDSAAVSALLAACATAGCSASFCPMKFGAVTINKPANILLEPGTFTITDTIAFSRMVGGMFKGVTGPSQSSGIGTRLVWGGGARNPMFTYDDVNRLTSGDFRIVSSAATPLNVIWFFYNGTGASTVTPGYRKFENIIADGTDTGLTTRGAQYATPAAASCTADKVPWWCCTGVGTGACPASVNANNDFDVWDRVFIANGDDTQFVAWSFESTQSVMHLLFHSRFSGVLYGVSTASGLTDAGGQFNWIFGQGGSAKGSDFYIGTSNREGLIIGFDSENSQRFLDSTGPGAGSMPFTVQNSRWSAFAAIENTACIGSLNPNICCTGAGTGTCEYAVRWQARGPLKIQNSVIGDCSGCTHDVKLLLNASSSAVVTGEITGSQIKSTAADSAILAVTHASFERWRSLGNLKNNAGTITHLPDQEVLTPIVQGSLPSAINGTLMFCSDCTIANPCAGGGSGALAKRLNGVWVCN